MSTSNNATVDGSLEQIYFHIVAFELGKIASLRPDVIELGPFARYHTPEFETLWKTIFQHVWAQWRYENDLPNDSPPRFKSAPTATATGPAEITPGPVELLKFCGGGKDSLVAMKLLDEAGLAYSSLAYSHTRYGLATPQHDLIAGLLRHGNPRRHHRQWIYDDFMDSPVLRLAPDHGIRSITAAETPSSIFAALPIVLSHGYGSMVLAHEKSADTGNLTWEATGEEINHQWGKSLQPETLQDRYLQSELIANVRCFSILKPIHDLLIFNLLRKYPDAVTATHSCNVAKPWCRRCAKCAYVWLNYRAFLQRDLVDSMFTENLFDLRENRTWFRQLLGLDSHTPFECVGEVPEVRLAFELCRRRGFGGEAMEIFVDECPRIDVDGVAETYLAIDPHHSLMPKEVSSRMLPQMQLGAIAARAHIQSLID